MSSREALNEWLNRTESLTGPEVFDGIRRAAVDRLFADPSDIGEDMVDTIGRNDQRIGAWEPGLERAPRLDQDREPIDLDTLPAPRDPSYSAELGGLSVPDPPPLPDMRSVSGSAWPWESADSNVLGDIREWRRANELVGPPTSMSQGDMVEALLRPPFSDYELDDRYRVCLLWGGPAHGQSTTVSGHTPWVDVVTPTPIDFTRITLDTPVTPEWPQTVRYHRAHWCITQSAMPDIPGLNRSLFTYDSNRFLYTLDFYAHNIVGLGASEVTT